MDVISDILDMIEDIAELIITEMIRRKKIKRYKQSNGNERSKRKQCITK
ncbi:hypothetical protein IMSAGC011_01810 [Lachnospiraceae bacterium]|nr:hypothetical protein IMSAGC011_01810 [Lachnospiraceae bacterium]